MNIFKKSLHLWITLTSFTGFLAGWAFLAQAARQAVTQSVAKPIVSRVMVSLPPVQSVNSLLTIPSSNSNNLQAYRVIPATPTPQPVPTLQPQPQVLLFTPPLKTGGS